MYRLSVFRNTPNLWRWEARRGSVLLACGIAPSRVVAERDANEVVNA